MMTKIYMMQRIRPVFLILVVALFQVLPTLQVPLMRDLRPLQKTMLTCQQCFSQGLLKTNRNSNVNGF
jgi:hypothetical protein